MPKCDFTAQKMKFSIKDFASKCDPIDRKLRIWSHLLDKSLMKKLHFLCSLSIKLQSNFIDCNWSGTRNHLVHKGILNHLGQFCQMVEFSFMN